jgi:hypothetical protein
MFKVKDDIDLKELDRFSYSHQKSSGVYFDGLLIKEIKGEPYNIDICIDITTREIFQNRENRYCELQERFIQDLIDANLVEKVDE